MKLIGESSLEVQEMRQYFDRREEMARHTLEDEICVKIVKYDIQPFTKTAQ